MQDDDKVTQLLDEIKLARSELQEVEKTLSRRCVASVLAFGFLVTVTLLLGLCFEWLRWHGALAPITLKP
jgi:hypothetical protein